MDGVEIDQWAIGQRIAQHRFTQRTATASASPTSTGIPPPYRLARPHASEPYPRPVVHGGRRVTASGRNNALYQTAFRLGQLATRSDPDVPTVWRQLTCAAFDVGRLRDGRLLGSQVLEAQRVVTQRHCLTPRGSCGR
ncbi:hypothetical protein GCM10017581_089810 [Dactylosporangium matsuzakiense]|uniref:Uncharacterized protein n=1 Tax=Dactylosporangium matsuzakiense TaxID=53360 RepID=A0A9W6NS41_9ACTN|nr:hypothetical protein GCM10017581_089810 [Dactylosporangium matsuzakiense]